MDVVPSTPDKEDNYPHHSQNFPDDLWKQIFREAALPKLPLPQLLALRTVCTSFNRVIRSFPKINSAGILHPNYLQEIFDLRSLTIDSSALAVDFSLFTGLHTLKLDQPLSSLFPSWCGANDCSDFTTLWGGGNDCSDLTMLTNLTKLMLSTEHVSSLAPLGDSIQFLYLKRPFEIKEKEVLQLPNLKVYKTDASVDNYTGRLIQIFTEGTFEGYVKNALRQGNGVFHYADGDKYVGGYLDDVVNGLGIYYWKDGDRYEGQFEDGISSGVGTYFHRNGDRHEGEYLNDNMHGQGTYFWPDGFKYEGQFLEDERSGFGVVTWPGGTRKEECFFKGGGHAIFFFDNGDRFECTYDEGKMDGLGVVHPKNGEKYECSTYREAQSGTGHMFLAEGGRLDGTFNSDLKLEGHVVFRPFNADIFTGEFENGEPLVLSLDPGKRPMLGDLIPWYFASPPDEEGTKEENS